jgi:transcriptional regulator with XRE-family HTH domain
MTPREFKRLRKEAGFTLRELSAVMAVHKSTIVRWQSGRARIPEARARQVRQLHVEALKSQQKRGGVT